MSRGTSAARPSSWPRRCRPSARECCSRPPCSWRHSLLRWGDGRRAWRPLLLSGAAALALTLPWRIWFTAEGIRATRPRRLPRLVPAARPHAAVGRLVIRTLFDQGLWPFVAGVAVAAIALAALAGAWRLVTYAATFFVAAGAACAWAIWSNTSLSFSEDDSLNPIVRLTGTTILSLAVLTPLLLQAAWTGSGRREARPRRASPGPDALVWRSLGAWAIVAARRALASRLDASRVLAQRPPRRRAGIPLPRGLRYPRSPGSGGRLVGYADSYPEAFELRRRAVSSGVRNVEVRRDGCGRVRVFEGVS